MSSASQLHVSHVDQIRLDTYECHNSIRYTMVNGMPSSRLAFAAKHMTAEAVHSVHTVSQISAYMK